MTPQLPTGRSFGLGVGGVFIGLAALFWWRVAQVVEWVNTRIILTVFFAVVLTPVGGVMRLFGRNPLHGAGVQTNWVPHPAPKACLASRS
jgi:cytochrome bd-type quinol oxidase subunit 1